MPMQCPNDDAPFASLEIEDLRLDSCPRCGGLWFDRHELQRAEYLADPNVEWMDFEIWKHPERFEIEARAHGCPKCKTPMARLRYGDTNVEVDHCSACGGVWIEAGGFERIILALEEEAGRKPVSEVLRQTLLEAVGVLGNPKRASAEWGRFKHVYELLKVRLMVEHPALIKAIQEARGADPL